MTTNPVSEKFDPKSIREDFPIFRSNPELAYLDSAASSQKPEIVISAVDHFYRDYNSNIHRGVYGISEEATDRYEKARQKVARLINAERSRQIIFTRNTTEAINLVAYSWGIENIQEGDEILLTAMEHHSNLLPWQFLAQRTGAKLRWIEVSDDGRLELSELDRLLTDRTKLLAITHVSNVLGTINPLEFITSKAHAVAAKVLVDAAQSVPHFPVDLQKLNCDFLAFSGHKMLAPTGIGVLYGKLELLEKMPPFLGGGSMIRSVQRESSTFADLPAKFEAGTPHVAGAIGLGAAVDYLEKIGLEKIFNHEQILIEYAQEKLQSIDGIKIYGPKPMHKTGAITFNLDRIHPHDLAGILDQFGVAIRAGHHCAQPLMNKFCVNATVRASFYLYNTIEEVDRLYDGLLKAKKIFTRNR